MSGMEELAGIVAKMNADVEALNSLVKEKQMKIGALQQKSEQIAKLKKEISASNSAILPSRCLITSSCDTYGRSAAHSFCSVESTSASNSIAFIADNFSYH